MKFVKKTNPQLQSCNECAVQLAVRWAYFVRYFNNNNNNQLPANLLQSIVLLLDYNVLVPTGFVLGDAWEKTFSADLAV